MAGFRFQYESLLKRRREVEAQRLRELAEMVRERGRRLAEVRSLQETIVRSRHDLGGALIGAVDLSQVGRFAAFSGEARFRAQTLAMELGQFEQRVNEARERALEARRARQALELLRERRYEAWRLERARRETQELDELTAGRAARAMMGISDDTSDAAADLKTEAG